MAHALAHRLCPSPSMAVALAVALALNSGGTAALPAGRSYVVLARSDENEVRASARPRVSPSTTHCPSLRQVRRKAEANPGLVPYEFVVCKVNRLSGSSDAAHRRHSPRALETRSCRPWVGGTL
jgi:hypothetical protein